MNKPLAIFDLDGTLINTIQDLGAACNHALQHFGFPQHSAEEYPQLVGNGINRLIERSLPDGQKTEENILRLREVFVAYYNQHNKVHTTPYNGITELLKTLKVNNFALAVASNKYQAATEELVEYFFPNIFDIILGEREGCPRKPDPQIVKDIINAVKKIYPEQLSPVIYIGDSDVDMQTAKNANLTVIACTWGFCSEQTLMKYQPQHIVHSPNQLLDII